MKIYRSFLLWLVFLFFIFNYDGLTSSTPEVQDISDNQGKILFQEKQKGFQAYMEEDFKVASPLLKGACEAGDSTAQRLYADVCFRQLDEEPHSWMEAAMWYIASALGGDTESIAFLQNEIPDLLEWEESSDQIKGLVQKWVIETTLSFTKPIRPQDVNNYLVFKFDRPITIMMAQKLPYFLDKSMIAITYKLLGIGYSLIEDVLVPTHIQRTLEQARQIKCALEAHFENTECIITVNPTCYANGVVYQKYYEELKKNAEKYFNKPSNKKNSTLKKPEKAPKLSKIYHLLLDALQEETETKTVFELGNLTHLDYPWIRVGIELWERAKKQPFQTSSYSSQLLKTQLAQMDPSLFKGEREKDLKEILDKLEDRDIWPRSTDKDSNIVDQYANDMKKYFHTEISRADPIVLNVQDIFFRKIESLKRITVDFNKKEDLEFLLTPLCMFYCKELKLNHVKSIKTHFDHLLEAQRYYVHLENLYIVYNKKFSKRASWGQKIEKLFEELKVRQINVVEK